MPLPGGETAAQRNQRIDRERRARNRAERPAQIATAPVVAPAAAAVPVVAAPAARLRPAAVTPPQPKPGVSVYRPRPGIPTMKPKPTRPPTAPPATSVKLAAQRQALDDMAKGG